MRSLFGSELEICQAGRPEFQGAPKHICYCIGDLFNPESWSFSSGATLNSPAGGVTYTPVINPDGTSTTQIETAGNIGPVTVTHTTQDGNWSASGMGAQAGTPLVGGSVTIDTNGKLNFTSYVGLVSGTASFQMSSTPYSALQYDGAHLFVPPVVIDLDGDGIELTDAALSSVFWDTDGDGYASRTGWVAADDGFLAYDKDGDGSIRHHDEISFVGYTPDAKTDLEGLQSFDTNGDGKLSVSDAAFSEFGVWQDVNQNGSQDEGEFIRLADAGISEIDLTNDGRAGGFSGNKVFGSTSYRQTDGTYGGVADVALRYSSIFGFRTNEDGSRSYLLTSGGLREELSSTVTRSVSIASAGLLGAVGSGGSDGLIASDLNTVLFDGGNGNDRLIGGLGNDWLIGGSGDDSLIGGVGNDTLYVDADDIEILGGDGLDEVVVWDTRGVTLDLGASGIEIARGNIGDDRFVSQGDDAIFVNAGAGDDFVHGGGGNDHIALDSGDDFADGGGGDDTINAGVGDDRIRGGDGNDILVGGRGNDLVEGGKLDDKYIFNRGDGADIILDAATDPGQAELVNFLVPTAVGMGLLYNIDYGGPWGPTARVESDIIFGRQWDEDAYLALHPDALDTKSSGLVHWLDYGAAQGFAPTWRSQIETRAFDNEAYIAAYPAVGDPAQWVNSGFGERGYSHYMLHGRESGWQAFWKEPGTAVSFGPYLSDADLNVLLAGWRVYPAGQSMPYDAATLQQVLAKIYGGEDNIPDEFGRMGDSLQLGAGIRATDLAFAMAGNDLVIGIRGSEGADTPATAMADQITIKDWATDPTHRLEKITFADGQSFWIGDRQIVNGTSASDTFNGTANSDWIVAGSGNDTIDAGVLHDVIVGGDGDDTLSGGAGQDTLFGDAGNDTLNGGVDVDRIEGGSGNDALTGGDGGDTLLGGDGTDTLSGGAGDDELSGGRGNDILDGGTGNDIFTVNRDEGVDEIRDTGGDKDVLRFGPDIAPKDLLFEVSGNDLVIGILDLANRDTPMAQLVNKVVIKDWLSSDKRIETLVFSDGTQIPVAGLIFQLGDITPNTLAGDSGTNWQTGRSDDDTIYGFGDNDVLIGEAGNDHLEGGDGVDRLYGGTGNDTLLGGAGNDTLDGDAGNDSLAGSDGDDLIKGGDGVDTAWGDAGEDNLFGGRHNDQLHGGDARDILFGDAGDDQLWGDAGKDILFGGEDDDWLDGGADDDDMAGGVGADTLIGGAGNDGIYYLLSTSGVYIDLANNVAFGGEAEGDIISGFERAFGSSYTDVLIGDAGENFLNGLKGDDWLEGGAGADQLHGDAGEHDTVTYESSTAAVQVDLKAKTFSGGDAAGDYITGVEDLVGSTYSDTLTGDDAANTFSGGYGDDALAGGAGNDTLFGDGGWNLLQRSTDFGGAGWQYGPAGQEATVTADAVAAPDGLTAADLLAFGTGDHPVYQRAAMVVGVGQQVTGSIYVKQDTAAEAWLQIYMPGSVHQDSYAVFNFATGTIRAEGAVAAQLLPQVEAIGDGWYRISGSLTNQDATATGTVRISISGRDANGVASGSLYAWGAQLVPGASAGAYVPTEASAVTPSGNDTLNGEAGNDTLVGGGGTDQLAGGDGDDTLIGGAGADVLTGGAGIDTASYAEATARVAIDLIYGTGSAGALGNVYGGGEQIGDTLSSIENLTGSAYDDSLTGDDSTNILIGGDGADWLNGRAGSDTLVGGSGNDQLYGGDGDDTLVGGIGNDVIDGGAGIDTVSYADSATAVTANLTTLTASGDGAGDVLTNVEGLIGSDFSDTLIGSSAANRLEGGKGNDVLHGEGGADTLVGGAGIDTASYASSSAGVTVNLVTGTGSGGHAQGDSLSGIEGIIGSSYADTLIGCAGDESLAGGAGNDNLQGGAGNDTYRFGLGGGVETVYDDYRYQQAYTYQTSYQEWVVDGSSDTEGGHMEWGHWETRYQTNTGYQTVQGDAGVDELDFGAGITTADLLFEMVGNDLIIGLQNAEGTLAAASQATDRVILQSWDNTLNRVETLRFVDGSTLTIQSGGSGNDVLTGGMVGGVLLGADGNDTLTGNNGADMLDGGVGDDTLNGGTGDDTYVLDSYGDVLVEAAGGGIDTVRSSLNYTLQSADIENLTLTGAALYAAGNQVANVITGNGNDNIMWGEGGSDTLYGGAGNDTLKGGFHNTNDTSDAGDPLGNDMLYGEEGNDTLLGQGGNDLLDGGIGDDTLEGGVGNDTLIGGAGTNIYLFGRGSGQDTIIVDPSVTKSDTLRFGAGIAASDIVLQNSGSDLIVGLRNLNDPYAPLNALVDRVVLKDWFASAAHQVGRLELADGTVLQIGSTNTLQSVTADSQTVTTGSANDVLLGGSGNDTLDGGAGNDTLAGGAGGDTLTGGAGNDVLVGGDNNDILVGGSGADTLNGGSGIDNGFYLWSTAAVNIDLTAGTASGGDAQGDVLSGIEDLTGSAYGDTLTGDNGANWLAGQAGNDLLDGGIGDDTLEGGVGNDTLIGGAGTNIYLFGRGSGQDMIIVDPSVTKSDTLRFGAGIAASDIVLQNSGSDLIVGLRNLNDPYAPLNALVDRVVLKDWFASAAHQVGRLELADGTVLQIGSTNTLQSVTADSQTVTTGGANDVLLGGSGNDTLDGGAGNDTLAGGAGGDTLTGGAGNDVLVGGDNNDILVGGSGADTLNGGSGIDNGFYLWSTAAVNIDLTAGTASGGDAQGDVLSGIEDLTGSAYGDTLTGDNGANWLAGQAGNDILSGGSGDDLLGGGDGNDTFLVARADGIDSISQSGITDAAATTDLLRFSTGVAFDQLWFRQSGNDLRIDVIGEAASSVYLKDWYTDSSRRIDSIQTVDGSHGLASVNVQALVDAMAGFSPPSAGQMTLAAAGLDDDLNATLVANWA